MSTPNRSKIALRRPQPLEIAGWGRKMLRKNTKICIFAGDLLKNHKIMKKQQNLMELMVQTCITKWHNKGTASTGNTVKPNENRRFSWRSKSSQNWNIQIHRRKLCRERHDKNALCIWNGNRRASAAGTKKMKMREFAKTHFFATFLKVAIAQTPLPPVSKRSTSKNTHFSRVRGGWPPSRPKWLWPERRSFFCHWKSESSKFANSKKYVLAKGFAKKYGWRSRIFPQMPTKPLRESFFCMVFDGKVEANTSATSVHHQRASFLRSKMPIKWMK